MAKGVASYVLPKFNFHPYLEINEGEHFGHVELFRSTSLFESLI